MLQTLREKLKETYPDFDTKYQSFIMEVQDRNLEAEIQYMKRANKLDVMFMVGIIDHTFKAVKQNDSYK